MNFVQDTRFAIRLMLQLLGVAPYRGRVFMSADFEPDKQNVLVISYGLWQRRFGSASDVIGKAVMLDGAPYTIIGIMPREFHFAPFWITQSEMWGPLPVGNITDRLGHSLRVFGRLRSGVSVAAAQSEVDGICRN